jgi:hypothetical protein
MLLKEGRNPDLGHRMCIAPVLVILASEALKSPAHHAIDVGHCFVMYPLSVLDGQGRIRSFGENYVQGGSTPLCSRLKLEISPYGRNPPITTSTISICLPMAKFQSGRIYG